MARYSYRDVVATTTPLSNWSKLFVHPVFDRVLWLLANTLRIPPNLLTGLAFSLQVAAAFFFLRAEYLPAAILHYVAFGIDGIDGAYARLTGQTSRIGAWADAFLGYVGSILTCAAFTIGLFRATWDFQVLYLGFALSLVIGIYLFLAEITSRLAGARPLEMVKGSRSRLKTAIECIGLVPSPYSHADLEATYLLIFPLLGYPILGLWIATCLGLATRLLAIGLVGARLRRPRKDS